MKRDLRAEAFSAWPSAQYPLSGPACLPGTFIGQEKGGSIPVLTAGSQIEGSETSPGLTAEGRAAGAASRKGKRWAGRLGPSTLLLLRLSPLWKWERLSPVHPFPSWAGANLCPSRSPPGWGLSGSQDGLSKAPASA